MTSRDTETEPHVHLGEWCSPCVLQGRSYERNLLSKSGPERSQPASEPSLLPGQHVRVLPGYDVMFEDDNGNPIAPTSAPSLDAARLARAIAEVVFSPGPKGVIREWHRIDAEKIAAEYQRLSQPADNEAAESDAGVS